MKFSIVTPVYNGEQYIAETIESVLSQEGDFEIEYIIADGGSTDKTMYIVKSYEQRLSTGQYPIHCKKITFIHFSTKDNGMYDAIEKGFARTTGEMMAYINADDKYLPSAFAVVASIFSAHSDVAWIKGINITSDETGSIVNNGKCLLYRREWLQKGVYGRNAYFVQQDSVFWRQSLWKKARPNIALYRLAGDYALWVAFAKHASLWSFNKQVSVFRRHASQLSNTMDPYRKEQKIIVPRHFFLEKRVSLFFLLERFLKLIPNGIASKILFFILFPFQKKQWYIDFDSVGNPIKKKIVNLFCMTARANIKQIPLFKWTIVLFRVLKRKRGIVATVKEFAGFLRDWKNYKKLPRNSSFALSTGDIYPRLFDKTSTTSIDPVYFYQNAWCAKKIFENKPSYHYDVGSKADLVGIISQFVPTTMVDIRPLEVALPELSFVKGTILELPFKDDSVPSLSSICVIEHIGLGRYGDQLDQFGSEKAVKELTRVLSRGGSLYISVPIDNKNKTYFNAHRAFTRDYVIKLFSSLSLVEERYIYGKNISDAFDSYKNFGTGLFWFKK